MNALRVNGDVMQWAWPHAWMNLCFTSYRSGEIENWMCFAENENWKIKIDKRNDNNDSPFLNFSYNFLCAVVGTTFVRRGNPADPHKSTWTSWVWILIMSMTDDRAEWDRIIVIIPPFPARRRYCWPFSCAKRIWYGYRSHSIVSIK